MKWFEGSIPDAIQRAKINKSVFIVYITGVDEVSGRMDGTWEEPAVSSACERAGCVGLRLEANSDACAQFSQIFPVVCVPSTFFIGDSGVPLEISGGFLDVAALVEKIETVLQIQRSRVEAGTTSAPLVAQTGTTPSDDLAATPSLEERVDRTRTQLAERRETKAGNERQQSRDAELERRELGKQSGKLKAMKADEERKEAAASWRKEKAETEAARERVRAQIAQDRLERSAKYHKEKEDREVATEALRQARQEGEEEKREERDNARRQFARIQFRLPDGSTVTQQFASSEPLIVAKNFITDRARLTVGAAFSLVQMFPRRTFVSADMQTSLLDLDLAPTAVLVLVPATGGAMSAVSGSTGLLWSLLAPLRGVWNTLYNLLFGRPSQPRGASNSPPQPQGAYNSPPQGEALAPRPANTSDDNAARSRPKSSYGVRSRHQGKTHRLFSSDETPPDDDGATWNGNSTQQL